MNQQLDRMRKVETNLTQIANIIKEGDFGTIMKEGGPGDDDLSEAPNRAADALTDLGEHVRTELNAMIEKKDQSA